MCRYISVRRSPPLHPPKRAERPERRVRGVAVGWLARGCLPERPGARAGKALLAYAFSLGVLPRKARGARGRIVGRRSGLEPEDLSDIVAYILSLGQAGEMP
jgi:hypothetical protein